MLAKREDFDSLFLQHFSRLIRLTFFITKDMALAEDAVQDTFLIVYEKLHTLRDRDKFPYWVNKIAVNNARALLRNKSKYCLVENTEVLNLYIDDCENSNPLYIIENNELYEYLYECLDSLEDLERQVFILRFFGEYSYRDIAQTLDINENTARSIIFRGKKILFFLGSILTEDARALGDRLKDYWYKTGVIATKTLNLNIKQPVQLKDVNEEFKTYEEAKDHFSFPILRPEFLPEGMLLNRIQLERVGAMEKVDLFYTVHSTHLKITQTVTDGGHGSTFIAADQANTEIRTIAKNNQEITVLVFKNGNITTKYNEGEILVSISARGIAFEEFKKLILSLK